MPIHVLVVASGEMIGSHNTLDGVLSWAPLYADRFASNSINFFESDDYIDFTFTTNVQELLIEDYEDQTNFVLVDTTKQDVLLSVPDPRLTMTLAQAKVAMISNINLYHQYRILSQYPLQRQVDIGALAYNPATGSAWTSSDKTAMTNYINAENTAIRTKTTAVNGLGDVAAVLAYNPYT